MVASKPLILSSDLLVGRETLISPSPLKIRLSLSANSSALATLFSPGISTMIPPATVCLILTLGRPISGKCIFFLAIASTSSQLLELPGATVIVTAALLGGLIAGFVAGFLALRLSSFADPGARFRCLPGVLSLASASVRFFSFLAASFSFLPRTLEQVTCDRQPGVYLSLSFPARFCLLSLRCLCSA